MSKKKLISGVIASTVILSATLGGCGLVSANAAADMSQVIAEINVSNAVTLDKELDAYKNTVGTSTVIKRELVAYFLNTGYSYIQSGLSYEQVFTMLMNGLIENGVLTQYATMYLLKEKAESENLTAQQVISEYESKETEVEKYEYLLGGKDSDDVKIATYSLYSSLNNAIDSYEKNILDEDSSTTGSDKRTTPGGVDTEKENFFPVDKDGELDYNVYTGYEGYLFPQSGAYQKDVLDGSTRSTRIRAYNSFISSLASSSYDLVDKKNENLRDILSLNYIQDEYKSQLEQRIINKYYEIYETEQEEFIKKDDYSFIDSTYNDILNLQTEQYATESSFASALGDMSDSSFILYSPDSEETGTYGFVYNILLPFNSSQSAQLTAMQTVYKDEKADGGYKADYYIARNALLRNIETTDQRSAWFNGEKEYAYHKENAVPGVDYYGDSGWLFFENNFENTYRYETLEKYAGKYAYNGKVFKAENDYVLVPEKLDIDEMLDEFMNYVNFVTGENIVSPITPNTNYYNLTADSLYTKENGKDKINYENFIYAEGKVNFTEDEAYNRANLLYSESDQYKVLSAVNELQYAYTTDTSVLSQYLGYSVEAGKTSYIKEFEHATHKAINNGAGSYAVCAGDYGWHLIYVTYTFDNKGGNQYSPNWAENIEKEGTFENLFYEMIKKNTISDISTTRRTQIITEYKTDETVTTYQNRYQDLLDLKNDNTNTNNNNNNNNNNNSGN